MIDLMPACDAVVRLLALVRDDQMDDATPCAGATVGFLIDHIDQTARGAAALARSDVEGMAAASAGVEAVHLEDGWRDRVAQDLLALGTAWHDPSAWEGVSDLGGLELASATWGRIALTELVVHGWEISRATAQPFEVPTATLQACFDHVVVFVPNAPVPELWGPPVQAEPGATLLEQIVAITGRDPHWTAKA